MALICIEEIEKQNHVIDKHSYELIITYTFMYQTKNAKVTYGFTTNNCRWI